MKQTLRLTSSVLALAGATAALALAACGKPPANTSAAADNSADNSTLASTDSGQGGAVTPPAGALPLAQTPPPAPAAPAPAAAALPAAPPAPVAPPAPPAQQYSYVDQAQAMSSAFASTPPDYAVTYQGAQPWVWRGQNGAYRVVEQVPGGERYYYYKAGASAPFLVRDPQYTYAYDQGRLEVVYDAGGRPLAQALAARQADLAGRYLARAQALYAVAQGQQRQAAYAADWRARQAELDRTQQQWARDQQQNAAWRAWHSQNAAAEQADWGREAAQRQAYAAQLARARTSGAIAQRGADQAQIGAMQRQTGVETAQARQQQARVAAAQAALAKAQASHEPPALKQRQVEAAETRLRQAQAGATAGAH